MKIQSSKFLVMGCGVWALIWSGCSGNIQLPAGPSVPPSDSDANVEAPAQPEVTAVPRLPEDSQPSTNDPQMQREMPPLDSATLLSNYQVSARVDSILVTRLNVSNMSLLFPGKFIDLELSSSDTMDDRERVNKRTVKNIKITGVNQLIRSGMDPLDFYSESVELGSLWVFVRIDDHGYASTSPLLTARVNIPLGGAAWEYDQKDRTFYLTHVETVSSADQSIQFAVTLLVQLRESDVPTRTPGPTFIPKPSDNSESAPYPKPESSWMPSTTRK